MKKRLDKKYQAREQALKANREIVPLCASAIRLVQKKQFKSAMKESNKIEQKIRAIERILKNYPDITNTVLGAAYQEYAELAIYLNFIEKKSLPALSVPPKYYMTGLGDAIGELKRYALELVSEGKDKEAKDLYEKLEDLYVEFASLTYPNSIVPGLKHKQDTARKILNDLRERVLLK